MRQETQRYDKIKATVEIVVSGVGKTGLSPLVAFRRISTNEYLQNGGTWDPGFDTNPMTEVDSTNMPGLYEFEIAPGDLTVLDSVDGYFFKVTEGSYQITQYGKIDPFVSPDAASIADAVWDELVADHTGTSGSTAELLAIIGGLSQFRHRIKNPTYDVDGRLLTAQLVVYPSSGAASGDFTPLATINVTATYDVDGNLDTFLATD
jgi:hypothetical protein